MSHAVAHEPAAGQVRSLGVEMHLPVPSVHQKVVRDQIVLSRVKTDPSGHGPGDDVARDQDV